MTESRNYGITELRNDGMSNWAKAGSIKELKELFSEENGTNAPKLPPIPPQ